MLIYKSQYIFRGFGNITKYYCSSSLINNSNKRFPYVFGGVPSNSCNQLQDKYQELISSSFGQRFPQLVVDSYKTLLQMLQQCNKQSMNSLLQENLAKSFTFSPVKIINRDAQISYKIQESSDRKVHQQSMMKLGYFEQSKFGLYLCQQKQHNYRNLSCLFQTQILYKTAMKLMPANQPQHQNRDNQEQQVHVIQYEAQGKFCPEFTDIGQQIKKYKEKINWFDMIGNKAKKLGLEFFLDILGIRKQLIQWKISDVDGFMQGNHPRIYPQYKKKQ